MYKGKFDAAFSKLKKYGKEATVIGLLVAQTACAGFYPTRSVIYDADGKPRATNTGDAAGMEYVSNTGEVTRVTPSNRTIISGWPWGGYGWGPSGFLGPGELMIQNNCDPPRVLPHLKKFRSPHKGQWP